MKNSKATEGSSRTQSKHSSSDEDHVDLTTVASVSFDRSGHVREINAAAATLFDHSPLAMLGRPFARFVAQHDAENFLHHLLCCRNKEPKVETEVHLRSGSGEKIPVRLSSVCVSSGAQSVRFRYLTTIIDLRESMERR